jgi:hypothetical protein
VNSHEPGDSVPPKTRLKKDVLDQPPKPFGKSRVSRQLVQPDDAATIANYSSPVFVLGGEWNPKLASIFAREAAANAGKSTVQNIRNLKALTQRAQRPQRIY